MCMEHLLPRLDMTEINLSLPTRSTLINVQITKLCDRKEKQYDEGKERRWKETKHLFPQHTIKWPNFHNFIFLTLGNSCELKKSNDYKDEGTPK